MPVRQILFTAEVGPPIHNGVVASMAIFAKGLTDLGHTVTSFVPHYRGQYLGANYIQYPQIPLPMPYAKGYGLGLPWFHWAKLRQIPFDVIHSHHMFSTGEFALRLARRLNVPFIHTYHTLLPEYAHYALAPGARSFLNYYTTWYANRVDQVIAPSNPIKDFLRSIQVRSPISVLPTGIDLDSFPIGQKNRLAGEIRKKYRLSHRDKLLIYVGRIAPEKNIDLLLEMMAILVKKEPKVRLILIGPGETKKFIEYTERLGISQFIQFSGAMLPKQLKEHLVAADVFVFGSQTDTQGIVILEAMASGCVPVAVNQGGPTDIIRDRVDGRLVSPFPEEFANRVHSLLNNQSFYIRLKHNALKKARGYSYRSQAQELIAIYEYEIARKRNG